MSADILQRSSQAGLYHLARERHEAIAQQAGRHGLGICQADLAACRTRTEMLVELGRACHFPEWYGANLDALFDCLADLAGQPGAGHVLLISGCAAPGRADNDALASLLEVLSAAAAEQCEAGSPLWILIDAPGHALPPFPGA